MIKATRTNFFIFDDLSIKKNLFEFKVGAFISGERFSGAV
jgi:hypothetical protein